LWGIGIICTCIMSADLDCMVGAATMRGMT